MRAVPVSVIREMESSACGFDLMLRAGRKIAGFIDSISANFRRVVFVCGSGNNAGDAFCAAAQIKLPHIIYSVSNYALYGGDASKALHKYRQKLVLAPEHLLQKEFLQPGDLIVDALLGIGFDGGNLRKGMAEWVKIINASHLPVISIDIPSGISGDSGKVSPDGAIKAVWTLACGLPRQGLFTGDAPEYRGILFPLDIGLPEYTGKAGFNVYTRSDAVLDLPRCSESVHKKSRGVTAVFAGSRKYPGAAALTTVSALRAGAGMVRLFSETRPQGLPDAAIFSEVCGGIAGIIESLSDTGTVVAGPGWGENTPPEYLKDVLAFGGRLVLDADALNLAARHPGLWHKRADLILTPHPGEARRLADGFGLELTENKISNALELAKRLHCVVILKGRDSVVASFDGRYSINTSGNYKLATAGSGDVLSGILGGVFHQFADAFEAACFGAYLHGACGESLPGFPLADDISNNIPAVWQELDFNCF